MDRKKTRRMHFVLGLLCLFWDVSEAARNTIDLRHIPMAFGYGDWELYWKSVLRVVTIGWNPAAEGPTGEKNPGVVGEKACSLVSRIMNDYDNGGHIRDSDVHEIFVAGNEYHKSAKKHTYFKYLDEIMKIFNCTYFMLEPGYNTAVHVDVTKWCTGCSGMGKFTR